MQEGGREPVVATKESQERLRRSAGVPEHLRSLLAPPLPGPLPECLRTEGSRRWAELGVMGELLPLPQPRPAPNILKNRIL